MGGPALADNPHHPKLPRPWTESQHSRLQGATSAHDVQLLLRTAVLQLGGRVKHVSQGRWSNLSRSGPESGHAHAVDTADGVSQQGTGRGAAAKPRHCHSRKPWPWSTSNPAHNRHAASARAACCPKASPSNTCKPAAARETSLGRMYVHQGGPCWLQQRLLQARCAHQPHTLAWQAPGRHWQEGRTWG